MTPLRKSPNPNFLGTIRTRFYSPDIGRVKNGQSVGHASPLLLNNPYERKDEPPPLVSGLMPSIRAGQRTGYMAVEPRSARRWHFRRVIWGHVYCRTEGRYYEVGLLLVRSDYCYLTLDLRISAISLWPLARAQYRAVLPPASLSIGLAPIFKSSSTISR